MLQRRSPNEQEICFVRNLDINGENGEEITLRNLDLGSGCGSHGRASGGMGAEFLEQLPQTTDKETNKQSNGHQNPSKRNIKN